MIIEDQGVRAVDDNRVLLAQPDQLLLVGKDGIRIGQGLLDVDFLIVRVDLQPGRAGGEAGVLAVVLPYRRLGVIALLTWIMAMTTGGSTPFHVAGLDVPVVLNGIELDVSHPDLFPLIHIGYAMQHVQEGGEQLSRLNLVLAIFAKARD